MARRFKVMVQEEYLARYAANAPRGVEELIWNAIDADAGRIRVVIERNDLGGVDAVHVEDDGHGMTPDEASDVFERLGGSWKLAAKGSRTKHRALHGRHGVGRYYAFGIHGSLVRWETVAEVAPGRRERTRIELEPGQKTSFEISEPVETDAPCGTTVSVLGISQDPRGVLAEAYRDRLTVAFALALEAYAVVVTLDGIDLDPASAQIRREDLDVEVSNPYGPVKLTVIEWSPNVQVNSGLYLCTPDGAALHSMSAGVHSGRRRATAYARWQGFHEFEDALLLEGLHPAVSPVLDAVRQRLTEYWRARDAQDQRGYIEEWRAQKVYPYREPPSTPVEVAEQELFGVVAVAAVQAVNLTQEIRARRYTLGLLKEAVQSGPSALRRVLQEVLDLPHDRVVELDALIQQTSLAAVISASRRIADRLDFLDALRGLVFDSEMKAHLKERSQLHRIIESETWIFGEEYALTASDRSLETVLERHLGLLGRDRLAPDEPLDGGRLRVDLMLARSMEQRRPRMEHLVVELKRPSVVLGEEEFLQITKYARAVAADEQFDMVDVSWDFMIVANQLGPWMDDQAHQPNRPEGLVFEVPGKNARVWAMTWGKVIADSEHRLRFVKQALDYNPTNETAAAYLNSRYADLLP